MSFSSFFLFFFSFSPFVSPPPLFAPSYSLLPFLFFLPQLCPPSSSPTYPFRTAPLFFPHPPPLCQTVTVLRPRSHGCASLRSGHGAVVGHCTSTAMSFRKVITTRKCIFNIVRLTSIFDKTNVNINIVA